MNRKLKIMLAVIVAGFLAFAGLYGIGAAGRESGGKDISWSRQAEETFYLSPGMGGKILSGNQWDLFQKEMKDMTPEDLSSFRLGMHKILMRDAHAQHIGVPRELPYDENLQDVKLNKDNDPVIRLVAGTTAGSVKAGSGSTSATAGGSISAGAATGLSGGSTPVTGSAGTTSGSPGGTASFGAFGQAATGNLTSTPVTGSSGSVGGTASFGDFNTPATPNLTSVPVTGTSGTTGGATGFEGNASPVTGTSGVASGATGGTAALSSFNPVADFNPASQSITSVSPTPQQTVNAATAALLAASGVTTGTSASQTSSLTAVSSSGAPVITITPNQSDISPGNPAMGIAGREPIYDICVQGSTIGAYAPVQAAATSQPSRASVSSGVVTSLDADRMFGSNPTTSTRRSVGSYDDSRGAIFHRDFDIGGGNRDRDRNDW